MALGIALMFGIILPQNFKVPYRATSLRDFWRRWHMTLSRFLRDYLYIPLGGNRHGIVVQVVALFVTMSLGGLWHGAGLTFVAWGVMHGLGLGVGILWRRLGWPMPVVLGWLCTMMFVIMAWVLFRAQTFGTAIIVYKGLFGLGPPSGSVEWSLFIPAAIVAMLGPTSWDAVHKIPPWRSIALAFAVVFVFVLYKIADDTNYEFIYFRF
jgi:alginate O-acetyltransferase complex protein AlgI